MRQLKITSSITPREEAALEKYLQDIGKIDLLTEEEEVSLAKLIKQGDKKALDKLTKANLRFVVSVAKQYQNQGLSLTDLINEGNVGLIQAAQRFDETRGFKFISYAVRPIRQTILQAISEHGKVVKRPRVKKRGTIGDEFMRFLQEKGYIPNEGELFDFLHEIYPEITFSDIKHYLTGRDVSLNVPIGEDGDIESIDMLTNENPRENSPSESISQETLERIVELLFPNIQVMNPGSNGTLVLDRQATNTRGKIKQELQDILCRSWGVTPYESPQSIEDIAGAYKTSKQTIRNKLDKIRKMMHYSGSNGPLQNEALYTVLREHNFLR